MYEAYGKTGNRCLVAVVGQRYAVNVMDEHVLRGNAAIIKCHIPSFVAEFVEVDSWIEDEKTEIYPSTDYGTRTYICCTIVYFHVGIHEYVAVSSCATIILEDEDVILGG